MILYSEPPMPNLKPKLLLSRFSTYFSSKESYVSEESKALGYGSIYDDKKLEEQYEMTRR